MPNFDSGRATNLGGLNIQQRRGSDINGIRFADNRSAPTSANDLVLYRRAGALYFWDGSTEYALLASVSGSVGNLNAVYENGSSITIDSGPIVLTDSTAAALDMLRLTKSGAGSGDSLEFLNTAAATGRAIYIDMDQAIARTGILIDSGGTARTGSDIQFTDDSTGAHSVIDINSSGSGASIGLDFTGTYSGSPAGSAISITLGNGNNLDTNGILFTGGTGVRTAPVINIDDAGTGSADIIDIDLTGAYTGDVFDFASGGAATGNVINILLDNAVAMTALRIAEAGAGARTQPMIEIASDATGSAHMIEIILTGAISGNMFDLSCDTTSTGDVFNVDMNAAVGGRFLFLDAGGGARTANLITVTYDSTGNTDFCEINDSNTGTAHVFDINVSGAGSGNVLDIVYGAAADTGDAISIDLGTTATGAQALVITSGVMTRTTTLINIDENGAASGNTIDIDIGAVTYTGNALDINLGATATGGQAIVIASGAMDRTVGLIEIGDAGTSSGPLIDINLTGAVTGGVIDIDTTAATTGDVINVGLGAADTGNVIHIDMNLGLAATAIRLDAGNGLRTQPLMETVFDGTGDTIGGTLWDINVTNTGATASPLFDIDVTAVYTGNIFDVVFGNASASTGHALHVDMGTNLAGNAVLIDAAGARTAPLVYIANTGTDGGTDDHVLYIYQTGILDSNLIQLEYATNASTGDALAITMAVNLAGSAVVVSAAGARTDDLIKIDDTGTGSAHIFDINLSGVYTGNVLDIAFSSAAATGEAISLAMGTNVAGRALYISSAGTGVTDEGNAIDIAHTGILVAGADVVSIVATGAISSTSNALYVATIGDSGAYAIKVNATGSAEAIHVDAGTVLFDETLTVTGATTLSSTIAVTGAATLSDTLAVTGASTFTGAVTCTTGCQSAASAVTATADGLTTGLINAGERFVAVTAGADANSIITLPTAVVGNIITGYIGATGCEMRTPAASNATINGVDSDGTNEAAIPATTMFEATCVAADTWILRAWTELGAVITAIVPDAA